MTESCQYILLQSRTERLRREVRRRDTPKVFPPDDLPRPSRAKAGLGLVVMMMMVMMMSRWSDEARQGARAGLAPPGISARSQVTLLSSS